MLLELPSAPPAGSSFVPQHSPPVAASSGARHLYSHAHPSPNPSPNQEAQKQLPHARTASRQLEGTKEAARAAQVQRGGEAQP